MTPHSRVRVRDAAGRERWLVVDADGRRCYLWAPGMDGRLVLSERAVRSCLTALGAVLTALYTHDAAASSANSP